MYFNQTVLVLAECVKDQKEVPDYIEELIQSIAEHA